MLLKLFKAAIFQFKAKYYFIHVELQGAGYKTVACLLRRAYNSNISKTVCMELSKTVCMELKQCVWN